MFLIASLLLLAFTFVLLSDFAHPPADYLASSGRPCTRLEYPESRYSTTGQYFRSGGGLSPYCVESFKQPPSRIVTRITHNSEVSALTSDDCRRLPNHILESGPFARISLAQPSTSRCAARVPVPTVLPCSGSRSPRSSSRTSRIALQRRSSNHLWAPERSAQHKEQEQPRILSGREIPQPLFLLGFSAG
ncbi:hypothetical protein DFH08DRAFT_897797 [Mycena albidolilacea]|uniref:Uncharacterized protein n=1 Tax=Mycena albidolilacea TaxID=1033008 RepID=A0AAD7ECV7_9AGAR|nr:hypothetical protein DFH08DRAFT_897797 [Mycena albidolilacea]